MADIVVDLVGCSREEAQDALDAHKEIWLAVDSLLTKSVLAGNKYIPSKPKVDSGMTLEQEELCRKGRDLQDKVNAVFSVAHSQNQTPSGGEVPLVLDVPVVPTVTVEMLPEVSE